MERLSAAASAVSGASASQALFSMLGTVLDFADSCSPEDDLTLLVVRRREAIMMSSPVRAIRIFRLLTGGRLRSCERRMPTGEEIFQIAELKFTPGSPSCNGGSGTGGVSKFMAKDGYGNAIHLNLP